MIRYIALLFLLFISAHVSADKKETLKNNSSKLTNVQKLEFEYSFIDGVKYRILGNYDSALNCFQNCLKLDSTSSAVKYEIASIFSIKEDFENALRFSRSSVIGNPNNIWYKILLANILQQTSRIEEACLVYHSICEKYKNKEEFYLLEAQSYASIEKWDKAIEAYKRYESQFGKTEPVSIEIIKIYTNTNNIKKATSELISLIKQYPEKSQYLSLLAELYFNSNNDKKGLQILDRLLKSGPQNGYVHFHLADYYRDKKLLEESDKHISLGLSCDEIDNELKIQYILQLIFKQNLGVSNQEKLQSYIHILVEKYPEDLSVRTLNADFLKNSGQIKEALDELKFVCSQDYNNYLIWEDLLLLSERINDTVTAIQYSKEALKYFPEQPLPYLFLGIKSFSENKISEAESYFREGINLSPEKTTIKIQFYFYLGECYYKQNKVTDCFKMFDLALDINPNNPVILNNYAYYLSLRRESLSKAELMSSQSVKLEPDNPTWLDTYAWVLYVRGNYSQARFYMKLALEKLKEVPGVYYNHFGDILYKNGEKDEALKMWKKALEAGIDDEKNLDILKNKIKTSKLPE